MSAGKVKVSKNWREIPGHKRLQMWGLAFHGGIGQLEPWIADIKAGFYKNYNILWIEKNNMVAAWAIMLNRYRDDHEIALYTRKSFRRQGLATKIYYKAEKIIDKKLVVCPHDTASIGFFKSLGRI